MASKKQKKSAIPDYKEMTLQSPGLGISLGINEPYGPEYKNETSGGAYSKCLIACGSCQQCACCLCATCGCGPLKEVPQGFIGLEIEFGRLKGKLGPGLHTINPMSEKLVLIDLRAQSLNTPGQVLLTRDNVTVLIDVFVNYRVVIPEFAYFKCTNYLELLNLMVQSVMKTIVAERTLSQLLVNRKEIEKSTTFFMDEKAHPYGIDVISIETQSINLPKNMERAMATVAESEKEAEAKMVDARGNLESAKIFREAADELSKNPISLELQYFETLKKIAGEFPSTLIVSDSIMGTIQKRTK